MRCCGVNVHALSEVSGKQEEQGGAAGGVAWNSVQEHVRGSEDVKQEHQRSDATRTRADVNNNGQPGNSKRRPSLRRSQVFRTSWAWSRGSAVSNASSAACWSRG